MHIAILGATSQIARDLIASLCADRAHELTLFARRPEQVQQWLAQAPPAHSCRVAGYAEFSHAQHFDVVFNFVGVGNPAQAAAMGASIFDVTLEYDQLALDYLRAHPHCRYIFLSSGAAYGPVFTEPAEQATKARVAINHVQAQDWYAVAKLHAECRHRALAPLNIIDIRVFNYFSRTQDLDARFLICDMLRAARDGTVLQTSPDPIVRDYLHPSDFYRLVNALLSAPAANAVVDSYSRAPIGKLDLLEAVGRHFGLRYEVTDARVGVNATGAKPHYYSQNRRAADFGYQPGLSSLEGILQEAGAMLGAGALPKQT